VVTGLFLAARDDSVQTGKFLSWLEKADTPVPKRTLLRWAATARAGLPVISPSKKTGASAIATPEQSAVLCGFVLHQNAKHIEVGRQDGAKFMLDQYGLVVSNRTIGNIFAKADLTRRRMRLRTSGYMKTEDELVAMYVDYVKELASHRRPEAHQRLARLHDDASQGLHPVRVRRQWQRSTQEPSQNDVAHQQPAHLRPARRIAVAVPLVHVQHGIPPRLGGVWQTVQAAP
jgi:hypothetical protein